MHDIESRKYTAFRVVDTCPSKSTPKHLNSLDGCGQLCISITGRGKGGLLFKILASTLNAMHLLLSVVQVQISARRGKGNAPMPRQCSATQNHGAQVAQTRAKEHEWVDTALRGALYSLIVIQWQACERARKMNLSFFLREGHILG